MAVGQREQRDMMLERKGVGEDFILKTTSLQKNIHCVQEHRRKSRSGGEDDRLRFAHVESETLDLNEIHELCVLDISLVFMSKVATSHRTCAGLSG